MSRTVIAVLAALLAAGVNVQAQEPTPAPSPEASPEAPPPPPPPPAAAPGGKVFNPDIAVIGNFLAAAGKNDVDPPPSFDMAESELALQAIVDPFARADFFISFASDEVDVEEAFVTFTSLPAGFLLKAGKLKAQIGKINTLHTHQINFVDVPLMEVNLLGGEEGVADAGLSLSRLFPNDLLYLEATGEVYRGDSSVFSAPERGKLAWVGRLRGYRDLSESTNLDLGASVARGHNGIAPESTTRLLAVDATLRWRPLRRAIYRRLLARAEMLWSRRELGVDPGGTAFGTYISGEYQFARRWFAGARWDRAGRADEPASVDKGVSAILTFWPSEFSQVRTQFRHLEYAEGETANEVLFQLQFSIGAHGAHTF